MNPLPRRRQVPRTIALVCGQAALHDRGLADAPATPVPPVPTRRTCPLCGHIARDGRATGRKTGGVTDYELRIRKWRHPLVLTPAFGGRELERRAP